MLRPFLALSIKQPPDFLVSVMHSSHSAVLLANASVQVPPGSPAATALDVDRHTRLKAALNTPGAMVAVHGREFLAVYPSVEAALQASLAFQELTEGLGQPGLPVAGKIVMDAWLADSQDMPVDRIHSVMDHAPHGTLLMLPEAIGCISPALRRMLAVPPGGDQFPGMVGVREYAWKDAAATYRESTRMMGAGHAIELYRSVTLTRRDRKLTLLPENCPINVGRESSCQLTVGGPAVSRVHGEVLYENGKFYYRDMSRNGSYLTIAGNEVFLHNDRMPLKAQGVISPGLALIDQTGDVIRFSCEALE